MRICPSLPWRDRPHDSSTSPINHKTLALPHTSQMRPANCYAMPRTSPSRDPLYSIVYDTSAFPDLCVHAIGTKAGPSTTALAATHPAHRCIPHTFCTHTIVPLQPLPRPTSTFYLPGQLAGRTAVHARKLHTIHDRPALAYASFNTLGVVSLGTRSELPSMKCVPRRYANMSSR